MTFDPRFNQVTIGANFPGGGSQFGFKAVSSTVWLGLFDSYDFPPNPPSNPAYSVTLAKSTDGGSTWTLHVIEAVDGSNYEINSMAVWSADGTNIYAFYTLTDFNDTNSLVKFAFSGDGGSTWFTDSTMTTPGPQVVVSGGGTEDINDFDIVFPFVGDGHIFYVVADGTSLELTAYISTDGGVSWTPSTIATNAFPYGIMAGAGSRLFCAYYDNTSDFPIVAHSTDCGLSWTPVTVAAEAANTGLQVGTADGNTVFAFWQIAGAGHGYKVSKSTDGGQTWGTPVIFDPAAIQGASAGTPSCFVANNLEPVIVYGDSETLGGYSPDLKIAQSSDGGATWSVNFVASDGAKYWAVCQWIDAAAPASFGIFASDPRPADGGIVVYQANTAITGAFSRTSFSCAATPTIVNGESFADGVVSGEGFSGGIVSGEDFT